LSCGARYEVKVAFYGHLGHYRCTACGLSRPTPQITATGCRLDGDLGTDLQIQTPAGSFGARLRVPGLYNIYNALAATAAALEIGLAPRAIAQGLETFSGAFGRLERIEVEGRLLLMTLVKNPVGFTEVLRTIVSASDRTTLLILINDLLADGTDVSWLWDVDFELLQGRIATVVCSGTRADDLAVRLKYAGLPIERLVVRSDPRLALEELLARTEPSDRAHVLPTYTAMLQVRDVLRRTGYVRHFYED
jgi:UDP-N-acetylmuramyl tripeptide synthase